MNAQMMPISLTPENLQALISQGEGQRLEFKRSLAELETGVRAVAAMANSDGGQVLFGVRDNGRVLGVEIGVQTKERVVQTITDNTDPILYPSVDYVALDGKAVEDKPHLVRGRAYKRVGAADVQMSQAEYERLLLARRQPPFDQQFVEGMAYADLDEARVQDFLRRRQEAYPDAAHQALRCPRWLPKCWKGHANEMGCWYPRTPACFSSDAIRSASCPGPR